MSTISSSFRWSKTERAILHDDFREVPGMTVRRCVRKYRDRMEILGTFFMDANVIYDAVPMVHPPD